MAVDRAYFIDLFEYTFCANHSTDHRAQTLAGLHKLGAPTVGQDYLNFCWEKRATR
jgi:uncharacterized damage-inducible protein DinB